MEDIFAMDDVPNLDDEEQVQALIPAAGDAGSDDEEQVAPGDDDHVAFSRNVVDVINVLIRKAELSEATSLPDLVGELCDELDRFKELTSISVCNEFKGLITRLLMKENEYLKFEDPAVDLNRKKSYIAQRAREFVRTCEEAPLAIAQHSRTFDFNNQTILVHGFSVAVFEVLKTAAHEDQKAFTVVCTEGRPENTGLRMAEKLTEVDIHVQLLPDSSVASIMNDDITMVLVGADGIMRNGGGGIINQIGTYQIAILAEKMKKPLYVAAESFKISSYPCPTTPTDFNRVFFRGIDFGVPVATQDYTAHRYIREFWTDSGRLTPGQACASLLLRV